MDYLKANYHTHTKRCHHAVGEDREYVEAAIASGIKILGFSDHIPIPDGPEEIDHIRMSVDETESYVKNIRRLKDEYRGDIKILLGYEGEYIPEYFEKQIEFLKGYGYDYLIMGEHYLDHGGMTYVGMPTKDESLLKQYVDTCIEGLATGEYMYLCHPGLVHYTGDGFLYLEEMTRLFTYCKENDIPLEINLLGILEKRHYPDELLIKLMGELQNKVIIGIDAHNPRHIGIKEPYEKAMYYVGKYQLDLVSEL